MEMNLAGLKLTVEQAAEQTGLEPARVRSLCAGGHVKFHQDGPRSPYRIAATDLEQLITADAEVKKRGRRKANELVDRVAELEERVTSLEEVCNALIADVERIKANDSRDGEYLPLTEPQSPVAPQDMYEVGAQASQAGDGVEGDLIDQVRDAAAANA